MSRKIVILLVIVTLLCATLTIGKEAKKNNCGNNETWNSCNATCEKSCGFPNGKRCLTKTHGCVCIEGLVRNKQGDCVKLSDCGDERRGPVEFLNSDSNN